MKTSNLIPPKAQQINGEKSSIHNSLSALPITGMKKTNHVESNTLQIRPPPKELQQKKPSQIVDPGYRVYSNILFY
jgi:hypothetical protein